MVAGIEKRPLELFMRNIDLSDFSSVHLVGRVIGEYMARWQVGFLAHWDKVCVDSPPQVLSRSLPDVCYVNRDADRLTLHKRGVGVIAKLEPRTLLNHGLSLGVRKAFLCGIGCPSSGLSSTLDGSGLLLNLLIRPMRSPPLESSDSSVEARRYESAPSSSFERFLYAIAALIGGGFVSFRLIVLGNDIIKPEWGNLALLFLAFVLCVVGFCLLLGVGMQYLDSRSYITQFGNQQVNCPLKWTT